MILSDTSVSGQLGLKTANCMMGNVSRDRCYMNGADRALNVKQAQIEQLLTCQPGKHCGDVHTGYTWYKSNQTRFYLYSTFKSDFWYTLKVELLIGI